MKLVDHIYGKARIKLMKVARGDVRHSLKELDILVMLRGRFDDSWAKSDNPPAFPADTMRNTVSALARRELGAETEPFGIIVARHFLEKYPQVEIVQVRLAEGCWERVAVHGRPHAQSFVEKSPARPFAEIVHSRCATVIKSGISNLVVLKTTPSGFEGFDAGDETTTLLKTKDRIMASELRASWWYGKQPASYAETNQKIIAAMLEVFSSSYSPSVQVTLNEMGEAALSAAPEISKVTLAMPNKHCLRAGPGHPDELLLQMDEAHRGMEGTVSRE